MQASRYRILGLVGQGQFGKVYCASDRRTGQLVALKELSHQRAPTHQFLQELWFIISLQHSHIAACRGLEHIQTGRYLVMDYCEGGTLRHLLEQQDSLRLKEALNLIIGVLEGLHYAHQRGIIHCDIKPENILLTLQSQGWHSKLSDFGIARHLPITGKSSAAQKPSLFTGGSPAYMAPERFYGLYSPKSDIYAVGIVLFELLVGDRPFHGLPSELMWLHLNQRLQIPDEIPEDLRNIIQKSLEKLPARRYNTAAEMAEALRQVMLSPQIQSLVDTILPWKTCDSLPEDHSPLSETNPVNSSLLLAHSIPLASVQDCLFPLNCTANFPYLYTTYSQMLEIWSPSKDGPSSLLESVEMCSQEKIRFSEPILSLLPVENGCCILTQNRIHYLTPFQRNPQFLLNLSAIKSFSESAPQKPTLYNDSLSSESSDFNKPQIEPCHQKLLYKIAIEPSNRYLTLAFSGQLRFYSLTDKFSSIYLKPIKKISLSISQVPEIFFLDSRHLIAVWLNFKQQNLNLFRVYTRRGLLIGNLKLSMPLKKLLPTPQPYTLLGIGQDDQPSLTLLRLKPLNVIRIPLSSPPTIACATPWGYAIADTQGKYTFFNLEGNVLGDYLGPINPQAITSWGEAGLVIASYTEQQGYLNFVKPIYFEQDL